MSLTVIASSIDFPARLQSASWRRGERDLPRQAGSLVELRDLSGAGQLASRDHRRVPERTKPVN